MRLTTLSDENSWILQNSYLCNFPENIPEELLSNYESIVQFKNLIKLSKPSKIILNKILNIVLEKIENDKRFQKELCIKLIRFQYSKEFVDYEVSDKLFKIYQALILNVNEVICWNLSVLLKDIELNEDNISWLIANFESSKHIQNRLLRYPSKNSQISEWARCNFERMLLQGRLSELIGLMLNTDENYDHNDKTALLWGIHYSKLDASTKKKLILHNLNEDNFSEAIKICERNSYFDTILFLYNKFIAE